MLPLLTMGRFRLHERHSSRATIESSLTISANDIPHSIMPDPSIISFIICILPLKLAPSASTLHELGFGYRSGVDGQYSNSSLLRLICLHCKMLVLV